MLVEYSKRAPLGEAVVHTFDGDHPCSLCHVISKGRNSEKKSEIQSPMPKIDMICPPRLIRLFPPLTPFEYAISHFSFSEGGHSPPVPPPRFHLS